jgi:hypothetical protein
VELSLPDRAGWSLDDAPPGLWLHGHHSASGSALTARRWRLQGPATAPRCAQEGRAQLTQEFVFDRRAARLVDARTLEAPPGFRTVVETYVVVEANPSGPATRGVLEAFGGGRRECFGLVFSTRAEGAGGAELVGERLASVLERTVRSAHDIDSLGLPEPLETGRP